MVGCCVFMPTLTPLSWSSPQHLCFVRSVVSIYEFECHINIYCCTCCYLDGDGSVSAGAVVFANNLASTNDGI